MQYEKSSKNIMGGMVFDGSPGSDTADGWKGSRTVRENKGYRIDGCRGKGEYTRIASVSKNPLISRYTDKNLDRKNTYYYKIRAYKMDKNKKVYGAYSSVKKVKM